MSVCRLHTWLDLTGVLAIMKSRLVDEETSHCMSLISCMSSTVTLPPLFLAGPLPGILCLRGAGRHRGVAAGRPSRPAPDPRPQPQLRLEREPAAGVTSPTLAWTPDWCFGWGLISHDPGCVTSCVLSSLLWHGGRSTSILGILQKWFLFRLLVIVTGTEGKTLLRGPHVY